jgi:hypothetical protein
LEVPLFWLKYRRRDGRFAGVVVTEATALIIARMQAAVFGLDDGLDFADGDKIDDASAYRIPQSMIDRLLDHRDLSRLRWLLLTKMRPAPSDKVRPRRKRQRRTDSEPRPVQRRTAHPTHGSHFTFVAVGFQSDAE